MVTHSKGKYTPYKKPTGWNVTKKAASQRAKKNVQVVA